MSISHEHMVILETLKGNYLYLAMTENRSFWWKFMQATWGVSNMHKENDYWENYEYCFENMIRDNPTFME